MIFSFECKETKYLFILTFIFRSNWSATSGFHHPNALRRWDCGYFVLWKFPSRSLLGSHWKHHKLCWSHSREDQQPQSVHRWLSGAANHQHHYHPQLIIRTFDICSIASAANYSQWHRSAASNKRTVEGSVVEASKVSILHVWPFLDIRRGVSFTAPTTKWN